MTLMCRVARLANAVSRLLFLGLLATPLAGVAGPLHAGDEARNFAAVLRVLQGDVGRLDGEGLPAVQRPVVEARVHSFLNMLPLLARHYLAGDAEMENATVERLRALSADYREGRMKQFSVQLQGLQEDFPLDTRRFAPAEVSPAQIRWAGRLYANQCLSCHGHQDLQSHMPAPNLFSWAHRLAPEEFAARMIVGVRGTPQISLQNPLTQTQMAALIAYFRTGP